MRGYLLVCLFLAAPALAQRPHAVQQCEPGRARADLRGATVRAGLYNNGNLFFGDATAAGGYIVPIDSSKSPIYAANFWLAGKVAGEVRAASATYDEFAFRPGRTAADGTAPTWDDCWEADRIWVVSRTDVETYDETGVATRDLAEWPVHLGAPARDGDGIPGNFDLAAGDRPMLSGDVTAFWVMTDTATPPRYGDAQAGPLGVDVTVEAFAFRLAPEALTSATFYRYTVTNRSGVTMDSLHAGLWFDYDLGYASDDHVGTDTTWAMVYGYNADEVDDEWDPNGYGPAPPAIGVAVLESPAGSDGQPLGLTASQHLFDIFPPCLDPQTPAAVLYRLRGRLDDGSPMREGGFGCGGPDSYAPVRFSFPGDPVTGQFWSEENADGNGTPNSGDDRQAMLATGPLTLAPDSTATFLYGILYGRGTSRLNSVTVLRDHARLAHTAQAIGRLDAVAATPPPQPDPPPFALRRPAPNPFTAETELGFVSLPPDLALTVRVVDVLGREVERHAVPPGTTRLRLGAGLAAGVYTVEVMGVGVSVPLTIVKAE